MRYLKRFKLNESVDLDELSDIKKEMEEILLDICDLGFDVKVGSFFKRYNQVLISKGEDYQLAEFFEPPVDVLLPLEHLFSYATSEGLKFEILTNGIYDGQYYSNKYALNHLDDMCNDGFIQYIKITFEKK